MFSLKVYFILSIIQPGKLGVTSSGPLSTGKAPPPRLVKPHKNLPSPLDPRAMILTEAAVTVPQAAGGGFTLISLLLDPIPSTSISITFMKCRSHPDTLMLGSL